MRTLLAVMLLAFAGGLLLAAGCGGSDDEEAPAEASAGAVPFDRSFIDAMVPHHREAIAMAKRAKELGLSQPELVEIADAITATQQAEIDRMLEWRAEWYGSNEVDPEGAAALGLDEAMIGLQHSPDDLAEADDVDAAFASMMTDHHNGAIAMAELALERASHEEVSELAADVIEAQQAEIERMEPHASGEHG
jgi:uncharacterized protein (DUF305 family)